MNVETLCGKPVKFRDWIFFSLTMAFILSWAYRIGAGELATSLSLVITNLFLGSAIGYCALSYFLYQRYLKRAQAAYEVALLQMSKNKLRRFINSDDISPLSKRFANEHYQKRFLKMDLNA